MKISQMTNGIKRGFNKTKSRVVKSAYNMRFMFLATIILVTLILVISFVATFFGGVSSDKAKNIAYNSLKEAGVKLDNYMILEPKPENQGFLIVFRPIDPTITKEVYYVTVDKNGKIEKNYTQDK